MKAGQFWMECLKIDGFLNKGFIAKVAESENGVERAGNMKLGTGNWELGTGNWELGAGNGEKALRTG